MITGQQLGNDIDLMKEFYTLAPEHVKELAHQFKQFYKFHKRKVLNLYYDRSGNQNAPIKKDYTSELKTHIEKEGWVVHLMNKNRATIFQEEEFNLMKHFFGGSINALPQIRIDKFGFKNYISSLKLAKLKLSKHRAIGWTS
ncbi:MAG: patatin-like phospholipase/acyl hydrolase [Polaribacter sp.]|jgi:patatin-like phospholipase/acyl hydrolase